MKNWGQLDNINIANIDAELEKSRLVFQSLLRGKWKNSGKEPIQGAKYLPPEMLFGAQIFTDREAILQNLCGAQRIVEIGTWDGAFAKRMFEIIKPRELYIIDIDLCRLDREYFSKITNARVIIREGNSSIVLSEFPDDYFNFIYVDGDHSYNGALKDIEVAYEKVK